MDQELDLDTTPLDIALELGGEDLERSRFRFSGGRRPRRDHRVRPSRPRPPRLHSRPVRVPVIYRRRRSLVPVDITEAPAGTEQGRWLQDCLNRIFGMALPITGVIGPETRSTVRRFQRQEGLRPTGIAGPDTRQALRAACRQQAEIVDELLELDEELGPLTASLTWQPRNGAPRLYRRDEAARIPGGGVYIVVDSADGERVEHILKVGKTASFAFRFGKGRTYREPLPNLRDKGAASVPPQRLRFYIGRFRGIDRLAHLERAVTRLLLLAGQRLPGGRTVARSPVLGTLKISNALPRPLQDQLDRAYAAAGRDPRRRPLTERDRSLLLLSPADFPLGWELAPELGDTGKPRHDQRCTCARCIAARTRGARFGGVAHAGQWLRRGDNILVIET